MKQNRTILIAISFLTIFTIVLYAAKSSRLSAPRGVITQNGGIAETHVDFIDEKFDIDKKRESVIALVEKGIAFFNDNDLVSSTNRFSHTKEFIEGELYLFLFDTKGVFFAHGQEPSLLWQNRYNDKNDLGALYIQDMIKLAQNGGGWTTYEWRGAIKVSYVKLVTKDGRDYVIGTGYYPHSKVDKVVGLVKGAVALFNSVVSENRPVTDAFSTLSYPLSKRFIIGDLYLYALDFNGIMMAQGERPGLIGGNAWLSKDSTGKFVNQEIIKKLKDTDKGVWVDYISKNTLKKAYAEKVQDNEGNFYFIACGYYPDAGREKAIDLVRRGYQFMKANGKSQAVKEFTSKRVSTFRYGDLFLFVYTMKGICVAHGGNEEFVGANQWDLKDENGHYYIREIIEKAEKGSGWVNYKINNSFESAYVEGVDLGIERLAIGCGLFPVSKSETMTLLVRSAASYLKAHSQEETFRSFVDRSGSFVRGDLFVFAFDDSGICYAYGDDFTLIWKNLIDLQDEDGKPFVRDMINMVKRGPSKIGYKLNGVPVVAYAVQVEKDGKNFILGSHFYQ
ncbi:MAG: cache domain-containing protein [Candidatus Babeliales bacterium]